MSTIPARIARPCIGVRYGLSAESAAKIDIVREAGSKSLEIFKRAGVKMGFGSDLLGPGHRMQSDKFSIRAQVLTPAEIIGRGDLSCLTGQGERIPLVMKGRRVEFNELD
ncbi:hypothetical protein [Paraburkholderia youngii]|uniref:hypothetical protein n=1 Tax=Paraburkholderia youngii TaxID=2782701 RepID=UPI003F628D3B